MKSSFFSRFSIMFSCIIILLSLCYPALSQEQVQNSETQGADQVTVLLESYTVLHMTYAECDEILTKYGGYGEKQEIYYNRVFSLQNLNRDSFYPIGFWLRLYYSETQSVVLEFEYANDHPVWKQLENEVALISVYDMAKEGDMESKDMTSAILTKAYYLLAGSSESAEKEKILLTIAIDLDHYKDLPKITDNWEDYGEIKFNIPVL